MSTLIDHGFGQSTVAGTTVSSSAITVSGANKYLRVLVEGSGTGTLPTSVVWDPGGANQAFSLSQDSGAFNSGIFRGGVYELIGPADGTLKVITATWAANQDERLIAVLAYTDVDQTTPTRALPTPTTGTTSPCNLTVTTVSGDSVAAFLVAGDLSPSLTACTSSLTLKDSGFATSNECTASANGTASGTSTSANWTLSTPYSCVWFAFGAALISAAGGGGGDIFMGQSCL